MEKYAVNDTKQYYIDKLNKEIYYIDNFFKTNDTIKKELLENYRILEKEHNINEFDYITKADLKEELKKEHLQTIHEAKEEYLQSIIDNILHEQIKKELLKTIENIKKINLSSTIDFFNLIGELIIKENIKNPDKPIRDIVCDLVIQELKL